MNPSREKNKGMYRRRKVDEKSSVGFLLCDPGWYVHKPDVQNKRDDKTENTHTHTHNTHIIGVSGSIQRTLQHNRIYFESVYGT